MTLSLLTRHYLQLNVVLLFSWAFFAVFRRVALSAVFRSGFGTGIGAKLRLTHLQWSRVAQMLILVSLITPAALRFIPEASLPVIDWSGFRESEEITSPTVRLKTKPNHSRPRAGQLQPAATDPLAWMAHPDPWLQGGFLFAWIMGLCFFSARLFRSGLELRSIVSNSTSIRALGRVRVVVSDSISIPFSFWLGSVSWVVLPSALLQSGGDFRLALRHELQHHRQRDTLWAVAIEILVCLFFPNPGIYLWKREMTELQELSCDEALIGHRNISPHEYGSCLVRVAEAALGSRKMHVGTTCMAAVSGNPFYLKSFLRRRVEMFAKMKDSKPHRGLGVVVGTAFAMLTVAAAFGAEQVLREHEQRIANPGEVVVDPEIQKIATGVLAKAIQDEKAKAGFAIVADPTTGRILAVANIDTTRKVPGYWALAEQFEPASSVKVMVAAQAIDKKLTTPDERHACENGKYSYGGRTYRDHREDGWDYLSTTETIAFSSDICSIKIGQKIGADGMIELLKNFGFGPEGTAATFPQARSGHLPVLDEDPSRPRLVPLVSMGVGFSVTPIEVLQAFGAIANGGNLMAPLGANAPDSSAQVLRRVISAETSEKMRKILEQVVLSGTGKGHAESKLYTTAGKTSSAHYPQMMPYDPVQTDFAGFVGFAPVKNPRVEIFIGIRDPLGKNGNVVGGIHAAPVFKDLAEEVLKFMKVAPDKG